MKFLGICKTIVLTALLSSIAALPAVAQSLTTIYAGGNSQNGNIFDITPTTNLTIDHFDINFENTRSTGLDATVEVYWRNGTSSGAENNPAGWTLLGTTSITGNPLGTPTPVAIGGLSMSAGQTYGIYIRLVEIERYLAYTDGGPTTFSNADLSLTTHAGIANGESVFAGSSFYPRQWNGTVYYTKAQTQTCASEGYTGTKLTWCQNICEKGYTGATLDTWIHRWINRYRDLPYCAAEDEEEPPQGQPPA
ncbi:MAG TPA: hypothetical protein VLC71_07455 [Thermomonas sp.]|nr:hypothetical protein [Thermomonas sp.]